MDYTPANQPPHPPPFVRSLKGAQPRYPNYDALKNTLTVASPTVQTAPSIAPFASLKAEAMPDELTSPAQNDASTRPTQSDFPEELTAPQRAADAAATVAQKEASDLEAAKQAATDTEAKLQESEKPSVVEKVVKHIPIVGPGVDFYKCAQTVTKKDTALTDRLEDLNAQVKGEPLSPQEIKSITDYARNQSTCGKDFAIDAGSDAVGLALGGGLGMTLAKQALLSVGIGTGVDAAVKQIDGIPKELPPATQERHALQNIKEQTVFTAGNKTYTFNNVDGEMSIARASHGDNATALVQADSKSDAPKTASLASRTAPKLRGLAM